MNNEYWYKGLKHAEYLTQETDKKDLHQLIQKVDCKRSQLIHQFAHDRSNKTISYLKGMTDYIEYAYNKADYLNS